MRYKDIISEAFEVNHRLIGYHATHYPQGLVLKNRGVKNMDSMGTWLASSREMVQHTFGPNVEAYELPHGRYIQGRQNESIEVILTNLPIIEKVFGKEVANHLMRYPLSPENRRFLGNVKQQARKRAVVAKERGALHYDHRDYLRYKAPDQLMRWKMLEKSDEYQGDIARSSEYCHAFREFMSRSYKGIAWVGNVGWDGWMKPVNIYLVFHDEDLIPIPELSGAKIAAPQEVGDDR